MKVPTAEVEQHQQSAPTQAVLRDVRSQTLSPLSPYPIVHTVRVAEQVQGKLMFLCAGVRHSASKRETVTPVIPINLSLNGQDRRSRLNSAKLNREQSCYAKKHDQVQALTLS